MRGHTCSVLGWCINSSHTCSAEGINTASSVLEGVQAYCSVRALFSAGVIDPPKNNSFKASALLVLLLGVLARALGPGPFWPI